MDRDARRVSENEGSTLGRGITVRGQISGDSSLSIEGSVEGEIGISGDLYVANEAEVRARVEAASATIEGTVDGEIVCGGPVRATAGALVRGTVRAESFAMEQGAQVSATIEAEFDLPPELTA